MEPWIIFTLLAVIMQSVRTAAQKQITQEISVQSATLVRFLFGIKFAALYFFLTMWIFQPINFELNIKFIISGALASVSQVLATVFLIKALTLKNFAVGTALAKTEALLTAVLGSIFFSAYLNPMGYLSILFGVCGLLIASNWDVTLKDLSDNQSIRYGFGAGLGFALASLWIRDASLSLEIPRIVSAAAVLLYMVILQSLICLVWISVKEPEQFMLIQKNLKSSLFIGFTGVLGSIGWFTAMSLQNAALVKTLGQIEFIASLLITYLYFNEKISTREYLGIAFIAFSLLLLIGAA
ncbi:DMT family transporter [Gammaproteobacteria bacterium]|nr:DMT family transporter [Gammaproteobacteria bacterium]